MNNLLPGLPPPDPSALHLSERLKEVIANEILSLGPITFSRYMQLALYAPGLGYYNSGTHKLGRKGDFITAPEISPIFSQCLARQCAQVLVALGGGDIIEFGAGSGIMAADILIELEKLQCLPHHYYIIELSPDLKNRQYQTLLQHAPALLNRVQWLDNLPKQAITGVVLANEVLDAMPIHRFYCHAEEIGEYFVDRQDKQFVWRKMASQDRALTLEVKRLQEEYIGTSEYSSEINLLLPAWLNSISLILNQGVILLIDYGFPQREYYHPDRGEGTLMCHYQHRSHSDPLILVGLQDITSHVDFTAVAQAAQANALAISGYSNQAAFLMGCGLADILQTNQYHSESERFNTHQQVKLLTLPSEMGELFKVIALTRRFDHFLIGFSIQNKLNRL